VSTADKVKGVVTMKGKQGLLATGVLAVLAMLALLMVASGALAGPLAFAPSASDGPAIESSTLQDGVFWNSGWLDISPGEVMTIEHDYGGDPGLYAVDVWFRDTDGELGIHHRAFGGMEFGEQYWGLAWQNLTANTIQLERMANDIFADQALVRIWVPDPAPLYDSGWFDIAAGGVMTLTHDLGGDIDDYSVAMRFRHACPEGYGVHLRSAGGMEHMGGMWLGAAWNSLTSETIRVVRFAHDWYVDEVRIQIYDPNPPAYDSGWQSVGAGQEVTLEHDLGGNPMTYIVRSFSRDTRPEGRGRNTWYRGGFEAGGKFFGSNWQKLTNTRISIYRQRDDDMRHTANEVRVWIFAPQHVYLPLMTNSFSASD
jgi:hypothetical protein